MRLYLFTYLINVKHHVFFNLMKSWINNSQIHTHLIRKKAWQIQKIDSFISPY